MTDHSARQWLHNFIDPDALTVRWQRKFAAFKSEVVNRPGKPIGHADGVSRTPPRALNMVSTEPKASAHDKTGSEWPNRSPKTNLGEKEGNLLESNESIAHCVSADFKQAARIVRKKQQFPMRKHSSNSVRKIDLWPQIIGKPHRFANHMITKTRYFPTYKTLRTYSLALKGHAETTNVARISMHRVRCSLDQLDPQKVKAMIQEVLRGPTVQVTVLTSPAVPEQYDAETTPEKPSSAEKTHV